MTREEVVVVLPNKKKKLTSRTPEMMMMPELTPDIPLKEIEEKNEKKKNPNP